MTTATEPTLPAGFVRSHLADAYEPARLSALEGQIAALAEQIAEAEALATQEPAGSLSDRLDAAARQQAAARVAEELRRERDSLDAEARALRVGAAYTTAYARFAALRADRDAAAGEFTTALRDALTPLLDRWHTRAGACQAEAQALIEQFGAVPYLDRGDYLDRADLMRAAGDGIRVEHLVIQALDQAQQARRLAAEEGARDG